jgi:HAE1 family hydrophobic/amphiphilic exporter-1
VGGGIIGWAIRRPVSVAVGVILVCMFGALSVRGIPIQLTPDVTVPSISVTTVWPGATPREIESEILEEQEEALKGLIGLVRMTSTANRGSGTVNLELRVGASLDEALVRVNNLLSQVPNYPLTARRPVITTANSSGPPLAVIIIQSTPPGRNVDAYRTWVDEVIIPQLERIKGVASVRLIGGREKEIHIDFDPAKLAARKLTIGRIVTAVRAELKDMSAGDIPMGKRRYTVRTEVVPPEPEKLGRLVVGGEGQTPILLEHVAKVSVGLRKREAMGLVDGAPSMALLFFREPGSNVLEVTHNIHTTVSDLQQRFLAPEGLEMRIVSDQTDYIEGALALVRNNLILGGILAILVLLLFLRSIGASAVVAISIPISIVGTGLLMSLAGRTINIVSLAGMAFAVGMVVDNSIVVLENIDTWRNKEPNVRRAALMGAREVWGAILASTLTTAAVFIPIITWEDEVGELLRDIAVAVSTSVFVSLIVSVIVIPSFAARLLRTRAPKKDEGDNPDAAEPGKLDPVPSDAELGRTGVAVRWLVRSPLRSVAVVIAAVGLATTIAITFLPSLEYLPRGNRNIVFGVLIPPPGYSVEEMQSIGEKIQSRLVPHVGVEKDGKPALQRTFFVGRPDQAFMGASAVNPKRVREVQKMVQGALREVPDSFGFASQASLFGRRLGGGRAIEIDITGANLPALVRTAGMLMGALRGALPGAQMRPIPGLDVGAQEFRVEPRRAQAAALGFTSAELGMLIDAYVDGAIIGELGRAGEPKRDVVLRAQGIQVTSPEGLKAAPAATPSGAIVPVSQIATLTEVVGPTVIQHIERRRAITLQVSPPDELALEDAINRVRGTVAGLRQAGKIPGNIRVDFSGTAGRLDQTKERFKWVLLLAVIISFLLLAALFEDFLAPIAILVTVPLAGAGGILGLRFVDRYLAEQPLDMLTALGFVILIGVVVNNAILIVDGALTRMREHGMSLADATASAVRWRVRPIMMSALTSMAGLLPMVLFPGSGSELYRGVGGIVLGGLALSTVLSLFVVPALFTTLWRFRALGKAAG